MATYEWNPHGVGINVNATASSITRTSATTFTAKISASWESASGTNFGMKVESGGKTIYIPKFDGSVYKRSGSGTLTGTYSVSKNVAQTVTINVKFTNYKTDSGSPTASRTETIKVSVPAWTSYTVKYSANGGSGQPGNQTKWKDQTLTLSSTEPKRTGYSFQGWATSSTGSVKYKSGASYTSNSSVTLYAVWKANTYTVSYNPNGGSGGPANQTKTYGVALTLSSTKPTRSGFNFLGWATSSSATTATYKVGVTNTYTGNAPLNLYAVWQTAYVKPKINSVTVSRGGEYHKYYKVTYNSETKEYIVTDEEISEDPKGTVVENAYTTDLKMVYEVTKNGANEYYYCRYSFTSLHVECTYSTFKESPNITVSWDPAVDGINSQSNQTTSTTGTYVLDKRGFDSDTQYAITITVSDSGGSTFVTSTLSGSKMPLDFVYDPETGKYGVSLGKAATELDMVDIAWLTKIRNNLCVGNKTGYLDGKDGVFISNEGYMHLQRNTAKNYNPYIAFLRDDEKSVTAQIQLDVDTNAIKIMGADDIYFGTSKVSMYRPYYTKGDTITIDMNTAGYVTNSGTDVTFMVSLAKPLSGISSISANTVKGLTLRQNTKYTHGSTASVYAIPSSYKAVSINNGNAVRITAIFTDTTNVTNNDSIGVYWNGSITFN